MNPNRRSPHNPPNSQHPVPSHKYSPKSQETSFFHDLHSTVYLFFMELKDRPNIKKRNAKFGPVLDGNWLVRWLHLHTFVYMIKTIFKPIGNKDMNNTREELYPERTYSEYLKARLKNVHMSFGRLIFLHIMFWPLLVAGGLAMAAAGISYAGPLFIQSIMKFIVNRQATHHDQTNAYRDAVIWFILFFIQVFIGQQAIWLAFQISVKVQHIIHLVIYDKMMRMSYAYRRFMQQGDFMMLYMVDAKIITNFVKNWTFLFSAPTTLITSQVFLYTEVGKYAPFMTGVIIVCLAVQIYIDWLVAKFTITKLNLYQERVTFNIEMLSGYQQLKSLGWEEFVNQKNKEIRKKENKYNRRIFFLNSLYIFIVMFAPPLIVFLVLMVALAGDGKSDFLTKHVYTIIAYVGLIYGPLAQLPAAIVAGMQCIASCKRIDQLYKVQDAVCLDAHSIQPGSLLVKNFIGSGDSQAAMRQYKRMKKFEKGEKKGNLSSAWQLHNIDEDQTGWAFGDAARRTEESIHVQIAIPFKIQLKPGDRMIVLGANSSGKSTFFRMLLGHVHILHGIFATGGKFGWCPQVPYLKHGTIKDNIFYYQPQDYNRLTEVQDFVGLSQQLRILQKYDDCQLDQVLSVMNPGLRQKIALARALYYNPDTYLLDNVFSQMNQDLIHKIRQNFDSRLPDKTLIVSTRVTSFYRPTDYIMIFERGTVVEFGKYEQLKRNPSSTMHKLIKEPVYVNGLPPYFFGDRVTNVQLSWEQRDIFRRLHGNRRLENGLVYRREHEDYQFTSPHQVEKKDNRPPPVAPKMYWKFIRLAPMWYYIGIFGLVAVGQGLNVFSIWWIGRARDPTWNLGTGAIIGIYVVLVCTYGLLLFLAGALVCFASLIGTQNFATEIMSCMAKGDVSWVQKLNKLFTVGVTAKDNDELFALNSILMGVWSNFLFYIGTVIMSGYTDGYCFLLAGLIAMGNLLGLFLYRRAEREMFYNGGGQTLQDYDRILENILLGVDTCRSYNKIDKGRERLMDAIYELSTVYKCNARWNMQGLMILSTICAVCVTLGANCMAIHRKFKQVQRINVIGTGISMSMRLTVISGMLTAGLANLQTLMRVTIQLPVMYVKGKQQPDYDKPVPPQNWPRESSVKVERLTFKSEVFQVKAVDEMSFEIEANSHVAVFEAGGGLSSETLLTLLNKVRRPVKNQDGTLGKVYIGGVPIDQIGAKFVREKVLLLDQYPFIFSGTLRQNLDPFKKHNDQQLQHALKCVGLWNDFSSTKHSSKATTTASTDSQTRFHPSQPTPQQDLKSKLDFMILDGGANVSIGQKQLINIARSILQKPQIVLFNFAASAVDMRRRSELWRILFEELPTSTKFVATEEEQTLRRLEKVLMFHEGKVVEYGGTEKLLADPASRIARALKEKQEGWEKSRMRGCRG